LRTAPYSRIEGKAERFIQNVEGDASTWVHSNPQRAHTKALRRWHHPHTALVGGPSISELDRNSLLTNDSQADLVE